MGRGDDIAVRPFVDISYKAFESMLDINSLSDITKIRGGSDKKYKYPFILPDTYFPCQYHLETLAHSTIWRNQENINTLAKSINHLSSIMREDNVMHVKIGNKYYVPLWAFVRPFKPFSTVGPFDTALRKTLTHLAMVGGNKIDVVRKTADVILETIEDDGVVRVTFETPYQKKYFKLNMSFSGPYSEIALETDHKSDVQIWCELTFWAVQFLHIIGFD